MNRFFFSILTFCFINTSFANSNWYDYCREHKIVLKKAKNDHPELSFKNGSCTNYIELGSIISEPTQGKEIEICDSKFDSLNFFGHRAYFTVKLLDPETANILTYKLKLDRQCKVKNIYEVKS